METEINLNFFAKPFMWNTVVPTDARSMKPFFFTKLGKKNFFFKEFSNQKHKGFFCFVTTQLDFLSKSFASWERMFSACFSPLFFGPLRVACGSLVPQPEVEPRLRAVNAKS